MESSIIDKKIRIVNHIDFGKCLVSKIYLKKNKPFLKIKPLIVYSKPSLHTVQIDFDKHIYDPVFAGLVSHSCSPNLVFNIENLTFFSVKDIYPEDILSQDYDKTEDELYQPFLCKCGNVNCRNQIKGKLIKKNENENEKN